MTNTDQLAANVDRGAAWLDDARPGWYLEIDLGTFKLSDAFRCVLGQLGRIIATENDVVLEQSGFDAIAFGDHNACIQQLRKAVTGEGRERRNTDWSDSHGFSVPSSERYDVVDDLWIKAIKQRVDA